MFSLCQPFSPSGAQPAVSRTDFNYHINGQLAERKVGNETEHFYWDGLALTRRNDTNYLNEPAVTGGNPVLANDKVMFNDMLGNTIGSHEDGKFSAIQRSAFGEQLSNSSTSKLSNFSTNFFTGKPYVKELGAVFLFRNYRTDQGKWQTADPMGYPDGWNNLAYVNNKVTNYIDWMGAVMRAVNGRQVAAPGNGWFYHSSTTVTLTQTEYDNLDSKYKSGTFQDKWQNS